MATKLVLLSWHYAYCYVLCVGFIHLLGFSEGKDEVIQGPNFIYEPMSKIVFSNMTGIQIHCAAFGKPPPYIQWITKDGKIVTDVTGLRRLLANGTLILSPFPGEEYREDIHAATYACTASNAGGRIRSRDIHVRAVVKQFYEVQVNDEFVINGNTAVFKCLIKPAFVKEHIKVILWVKDGTESIVGLGSKHSVLPSGELHIRNVTLADHYRRFRCKTEHMLIKDDRVSTTIGTLIVLDQQASISPRITDSKGSVTVIIGETVELPCAAQGQPIPTYRWKYADGRQVVLSNRIQQFGGSLQIRNASPSDTGTYICEVSSSMGHESVRTELTVTVELAVHIEPQHQIVDVGKNAFFNCSIQGFPISMVMWMKDGQPLLPSNHIIFPTKSSLMLVSVQRQDKGMYQCHVTSGDLTVQASGQLSLGVVTPLLHEVFPEQTLQPGQFASLKCIASGNPTPEVFWTLDNQPFPETERFQLISFLDNNGDVVSQVNISNLRLEDGGEYRCLATNSAGLADHMARLNIYGSPYIRPMPNLTAVANENLFLRCYVSGYPIYSINWERGGIQLPINHRQSVHKNGTLKIQSIQRKVDEGIYTCVAKNLQGQASRRSIHISVMVPPKIDPFAFQSDLHQDMRARISCVVSSGDLPITITWVKDGIPIPLDLGITIKIDDEYSSSLGINNINPKHDGNYTCIASNAAATVSFTAELTVNVPPRWLIEPQDMFVVLGESVSINCQAQGSPNPEIIWKKSQGDIPGGYVPLHYNTTHMTLFDNGTLVIEHSREADQGYYLCQASNGVGAGLSKVVFLTVHIPASFTERDQEMTVMKGRDMKLECRSKGDRPIELSWRVGGQIVDSKTNSRYAIREFAFEDGSASELTIMTVERRDSAIYTCIAKNAYGYAQKNISLKVQETPDKPMAVRVTGHNSRTVQLAWKSPFDGNSPVVKFVVQYKNASVTWPISFQNISVPASQTIATVTGLHPAITYHMRVFALNSLGYSDPSEVVMVTTEEEAPNGPPRDIIIEAIDSQVLKIHWKPPAIELRNGAIVGYRVGYKKYNSSAPFLYKTLSMADEIAEECLLTNLEKYTKYIIVLQAYNRMGSGPKSDEIIATTMEDVPSEPPIGVTASALTAQSIVVTWEPPPVQSLHGELQGYKVMFSPVREYEEEAEVQIKTATGQRFVLYGLEKFTNYTIRISAYTRRGDGVRSPPTYCRTHQDIPSPPSDIRALAVAKDTILVTWKPPNNPNGILTKYSLFMRSWQNGVQSSINKVLPAHQTSNEFTGLIKGHRYEFWVTASTFVGESERTRIVSQTPEFAVPARIASFPAQVISSWNKDVVLPCWAVGTPTPSIVWKSRGKTLKESDRIHILHNGSLWIEGVLSSDAGNYTCMAVNTHGTEEITYILTVQVPPKPPELYVNAVTTTSVTLMWKSGYNGGSPIQGYILHLKQEFQTWNFHKFNSVNNTIVLENLLCGSNYQFYLTTYNRVGTGEPSKVVPVRTKGVAPIKPDRSRLIFPNSTFVILSLNSWQNGGCPITSFVIEYCVKNGEWIVIPSSIGPGETTYKMKNLEPETHYNLRITAHNSAGSTIGEYNFVTLTHTGATIVPNTIIHDKDVPFYENLALIVPISICTVVVIVLLVAVIICRRRHRCPARKYKDSHAHNDLTAETALINDLDKNRNSDCTVDRDNTYSMIPPPGHNANLKVHGDPAIFGTIDSKRAPHWNSTESTDNNYDDDVNPYATFEIPGGIKDHHLDYTMATEPSTFGGGRPPPEWVQLQQKPQNDSQTPVNESMGVVSTILPQYDDQGVILNPRRYASADEISTLLDNRRPPYHHVKSESSTDGECESPHSSPCSTSGDTATEPGIVEFTQCPPLPDERRQSSIIAPIYKEDLLDKEKVAEWQNMLGDPYLSLQRHTASVIPPTRKYIKSMRPPPPPRIEEMSGDSRYFYSPDTSRMIPVRPPNPPSDSEWSPETEADIIQATSLNQTPTLPIDEQLDEVALSLFRQLGHITDILPELVSQTPHGNLWTKKKRRRRTRGTPATSQLYDKRPSSQNPHHYVT